MPKMSGAWESFSRSRMATLAVNALLLSAGSPSSRAVAAASAAPGWSGPASAGKNMIHQITHHLRHHTTAAAVSPSSPSSTPPSVSSTSGKDLPRHRRDKVGDNRECENKRASAEDPQRRSRRGAQRGALLPPGRTSTRQNMRNKSSSGTAGWVQQAERREGLGDKVPGLRAAVAAGAGRGEVGARHAADAAVGSKHYRGWGVAGWAKRLRGGRALSSSSCDDNSSSIRHNQQQQQQQQQQESLYERTASAINTMMKAPPVTPAVAGVATAASAAASPSPVPSYLRWPSKTAAEPKQQGDDVEADGQNRDKIALPRSTRRAAGKSNDVATAPSAGEEEGSLGAAKASRGGGSGSAVSLTFTEAMFAGAISRSIAQTCMQPANVVKTLLQGRGTASQLSNLSFKLLTRGAGAQFVMSLPHGAFNYATLEVILGCSAKIFPDEWRERAGPVLDFFSSSVATVVCSVVSTPQMVLTDRIMAGIYPNLASGVREITRTQGLPGFYVGWSANVAQKIPSYGLTWVFFQQFKRLHRKATDRPPTNTENFVLGAAAAGATVCIMIPMDTVKTRLVTQTAQAGVVPYKGVLQTLTRIVREEGLGPIYRSLAPRLVSVVPMIGIQFGIYEFVRKELMNRKGEEKKPLDWLHPAVRRTLRIGADRGSMQPDFFKDFLRNVYLIEEDMI